MLAATATAMFEATILEAGTALMALAGWLAVVGIDEGAACMPVQGGCGGDGMRADTYVER